MTMTDDEIRRNYSESKDKKEQIIILADLNCCTRHRIKEIVGIVSKKDNKAEISSKDKEMVVLPAPRKDNAAKSEEIFGKLDGIETKLEQLTAEIKTLERQYDEYVSTLRVLAEYEEC
jgi:hypothetical protein